MPFLAPDGGDPISYTIRIREASIPAENAIKSAMDEQVQRIKTRTSLGVDYTGTPFAPYSTGTTHSITVPSGPNRGRRQRQLAKRTSGHALKSSYKVSYKGYAAYHAAVTGTDTVNLFLHGDMMNALGPFSEPPIYGYGVEDEKQSTKARAHNEGTSRLPQRRFMDTSESDLEVMEKSIGEDCDNRLKGLL